MREGWKCPECGKINGPHVDACDHEQIGRTASNNREVVYVPYEAPGWWLHSFPVNPWGHGYPASTHGITTTDASDKYKAEMEAGV